MLSIITAGCGRPEVFEEFFKATLFQTEGFPELVVVHNGSTRREVAEVSDALSKTGALKCLSDVTIVAVDDPLGSAAAFNLGAQRASGDKLALLHNDLLIYSGGWDMTVIRFLDEHHEAGLLGLHGARRMGSPDIYRTPYQLVQLARGDTLSNLVDWQSHGAHCSAATSVAVLDGMGLFCRASDWNAWDGFDTNLGLHHMYDNDLSLRSLESGKVNYVLPLQAKHVSGQTANFPRYQDHLIRQGIDGDAAVHRDVHERFYSKWQGKLPVVVQ